MRIVFFGSGNFAVPILKFLLENNEDVVAVVTQADKRAGRGLCLKPTAIKEFTLKSSIPADLYQPSSIKDPDFIGRIKKLSPDIFIVVSYGDLIGKDLLDIPAVMPLNIHSSLLPKYRGAAPINWAIINGDKETGITIFKMNSALDKGDIILQKRCSIEHDLDVCGLEQKLSGISIQALEQALFKIKSGNFPLYPQKGPGCYAPRLKKEDGFINWNCSAQEIYNRIRGLRPWPSAYTYLDFKIFKILSAEIDESDYPGAVSSEVIRLGKSGLIVKCGQHALRLNKVQLEGGKAMGIGDFLRGHNIKSGCKLGA
ncbi:MAG TPA: methionyl-tRNA formyltransferase [Candidatus Omnitrophica bacterium]|nr:methionyl-tRNA formyltransferase [Candidatus Omnitrophota bacterium]